MNIRELARWATELEEENRDAEIVGGVPGEGQGGFDIVLESEWEDPTKAPNYWGSVTLYVEDEE